MSVIASVGQQIEFLGATKLPSVKTRSGFKMINEVEQFLRVGQGSVMLEHKGLVKDLADTISENDWIDERSKNTTTDLSEKLILNIFRFIKKYYRYLTAFLFGVVLTALFMK